jgi:6-pyruvoyltetrahydropterin/6-carboxytetrahydropterin synthase
MEIYKEFTFEAAHRLTGVPEGHKCARLHGHSYRVRITVAGDVDLRTGMVVDFSDLARVVEPCVGELDHRYLNEIEGLENPTSENVACWFWRRLEPQLPLLVAVEIAETCSSGVVLRRGFE